MGSELEPPRSDSRGEVVLAPSQQTYLELEDRYGFGPNPTIDGRRILGFLRRRWATIVGGFLLVMLAAGGLTYMAPKVYESSASFLVEQRKSTPTDVPALEVLERLGDVASAQTEVHLIRSRRVVEPVVESGKLNLNLEGPDGPIRVDELFASLAGGREAKPGEYLIRLESGGEVTVSDAETGAVLARASDGQYLAFAGIATELLQGVAPGAYVLTVRPFSRSVQQALARLDVAVAERDVDLVRLTCLGQTPDGAKLLCDSVAASYLRLRAELQRVEATAAADILASQAESARQRLVRAEDSLRAYSERVRAVALDTRAQEVVRQNAELWAEREQLRAERASLSSLIQQIEADTSAGSHRYRELAAFPTFLRNQNQIVTELVGQLIVLENRRSDLAIRRSEGDVELAALNAQISDVEIQLRNIAEGYERALGAQIESLEQGLSNSSAQLAAVPAQQVETARLERQVDLLGELYSFLHTRLQEAQIAQAVELPSVRVVDHPALPFEPSSPNVPLNLMLGFLFATGSGLLLGVLREAFDTKVHDHSKMEENTGIPVLSMLPRQKTPGPVILSQLPAPNGNGSPRRRSRVSNERELALEAFRSLNLDLTFVGRDIRNGGLRSVAVTSPGQGEGKTYTACNLAIVRASHDARTLLIDADIRARGVSRFLGLPATDAGLTEVLRGEAEPGDVTRRVLVGSSNTLWVLPAGAGTPESANLLERVAFRDLLERLVVDFDLVVVDTPPLNVVTDAAAVSALVDGVVLVVRGGRTDQAALQLTLSRLDRAGARTAGIVLNDVDLPPHYRSYSYES